MAVSWFFMISGAVFYPRIRRESMDTVRFFVGRVFRIMPLYFVIVLNLTFWAVKTGITVPLRSLAKQILSWLLMYSFPDINKQWITPVRYMSGVQWTLVAEVFIFIYV
jgi:peptidoglycan/LPS O-acetylase OafA/YrhL